MKSENFKFWFCGLLCMMSTYTWGQEVQGTDTRLTNSFIAQKEPRYDNQEDLCAVVLVSVPNANTVTFENSMIVGNVIYSKGSARVYMAKGAKFLTVKSDKFGMYKHTFSAPLEKGVTYQLDLKIIYSEDHKTRTLVMPVVGVGGTMSYGAMIGVVKQTGVYGKVKYNFQSLSNDYECNNQGVIAGTDNNSWFTGENKISRFAITAGLLQRLWKPVYLYVGGGYGFKRLGWELESGEWAENTDKTLKV